MPSVLMIVAPSRFRDEELLVPKDIFESHGFNVVIASHDVKEATGMGGTVVKVHKDIGSINPKDYDAVVFVGGSGSTTFHNNRIAWNIAKETFFASKPLGAICMSVSTVANAIHELGHFHGKRMTGWPTERDNIAKKGGIYTGNSVEVDGKLITAKGPHDAEKFGKRIAEMLM